MKLKVTGQRTARHLIFALVVLLLGSVLSNASPITYTVARTIGTGSVTGFIETDGTLGVLSAGNFVDWSLLLNDGVSTFNLYGPLSGNNSVAYSQGSDASASATQLLFNFSGIDNGILLFQDGLFSGDHYYCAATQLGICYQGETVVPISVLSSFQNVARSGNIVIGTAVPEPGTYGLMLTGLGLLLGKRGTLGGLRAKLKANARN